MQSAHVEDVPKGRTWIKFCGCRTWADVSSAIEAGADAVGLIFASSPRRVGWDDARDIARRLPADDVEPVGVFVDPSAEEINAARMLFPRMSIQLSGNETAEFVHRYGERAIKAIHINGKQDPGDIADACRLYWQALILFDTRYGDLVGGTGRTFAWETVAPIGRERAVVVAGGLTPENVGDCIRALRPFGVDVRTGIETNDQKDPEKMAAFVRAVREADAS
ncbi:MAG TPA: phosphoribosylanthranilate isomerase [Candidatus Baltobacteraceae bacterium]|jgi:phosphoribosylanthranilate isomerase